MTLLLLFACNSAAPVHQPAPSALNARAPVEAPAEAPAKAPAESLPTFATVVELTIGEPNTSTASAAPMVLGLHGRGAHPQRFQGVLRGATGDYRVWLPLAPTPMGQGGTWFDTSVRGNPAVLAAGVHAAAAQLAEYIQQSSPTGQAVIFGFSQGGYLALTLASLWPERVVGAVAMGGSLPPALVPQGAAASPPPVVLLHGQADPVVPVQGATAAAQALREAGYPVELQVWPGVGHTVTEEMRERLQVELARMVRVGE